VNLFKAVPEDMFHAVYPLQMKRHLSEEASSYISSTLENGDFDIVHVEGYYLMQLLPPKLEVPVLLVEHNIEYSLSLQRMILSKSPQERSRYWREYVYTLKWERISWKRATLCVTLTTEDKTAMAKLEPNINIKMIPDGIDHQEITGESKFSNSLLKNNIALSKDAPILLVGNFAYEPNVDAALYFSQLIFPQVLQVVPNAKLFIVGNEPPPSLLTLTLNKQIEVTGCVESLIPFYNLAKVVVCPLRIGGGVKVKVLEALKAGKAIVSTSIGAQGLDVKTCQAVIVADVVTDFVKNVVRFLQNPEERFKQERVALAYAQNLPTWDHASEAFVRCYDEMITCNIKNN
jgi:polysaccharide biosynthesis protein PslH